MSLWRSLQADDRQGARLRRRRAAATSRCAATCIVMADDARIGYMPARVWGCPTTAMWVYRLGAERAKRMLFTGDTDRRRDGRRLGPGARRRVPAAELDAAVEALAERIAGVPQQPARDAEADDQPGLDNMGLREHADARDAVRRHHAPLARGPVVQALAETQGFHAAVEWRDSGRPLPNLEPGDAGDAFMAAPSKPASARSRWSSDVTGKRGKAKERPMSAPNKAFEPEFIARLKSIFEERIVFNRVLGLRIETLAAEGVAARIEMRPELIGHFTHQRLHGGVISATLDAMGGLAVLAAIGTRHLDEPIEARLQRFAKLGTIDLRVDYLRPATGPHFRATAQVLRLGSRVASTRMEFFDAEARLLATGAAAYIVS